jgi:hypothetical protein
MNNFMGCISLQVDNKDKICITYKTGQPNFTSYKRKYDHGFREIIDAISREECCGLNIPTKKCFLITDDDYIQIHDENTYKMKSRIDVPMKISDTDDPIEILSIKISKNEKFLAVLAGKNLIKSIEELHSLHIYEIKENGSYTILQNVDLPVAFRYFSVAFEFDKNEPHQAVLFADNNEIKRFDYNK